MSVLLVVVDAATPRVVCPAVQIGRLPTLQRLAAAGTMHQASATIFPSITSAATTAIITGVYVTGSSAHIGGASHGALHALDSLCPVIVAGPDAPARLPTAFRAVDIAPMCLEWLGLPSPYRIGEPRTNRRSASR